MDTGKIILIIFLVLVGYFVFRKFFKPTPITHDSTVLFTGGLGSGKSLNSVKVSIKAYKSAVFHWKLDNLKVKAWNWFFPNKKKGFAEKPMFKSNLPVKLGKDKYSSILTRDDLTLKTRIPVGSVVLIDELPQFINQFQWESAQGVLNEFITFFRHYVNGLLVCNAQSLDEVECHIRRKLSAYYYCFDFQPFFWIFYRCHILKCRVGDAAVSLTNEYVDDNAKWHYGFLVFAPYRSRYLMHRYDKVKKVNEAAFDDFYTNRILRFDTGYVSPLDDKETRK